MKKQGAFLACWLLFFGWKYLAAQVEFNVKVKPEASPLQALLWEQAQTGRPNPSAQLRSAYPWLAGLQSVHAVASGKALNASDWRGIFTIQFAQGEPNLLLESLLASQSFTFVEENHRRHITQFLPASPPNDAHISNQWYHEKIQTFEAWSITRGNSSVRVGVLDTGIDYSHPELAGQMWINPFEDLNHNGTFEPWADTVSQGGVWGDLNELDEDGNGFSDDVIGYDFTDQPRNPVGGDYLFPDADPLDENQHGTLVSGILVGKADNHYGGAGVAPGCRVVTLRCFGADGTGEDDDIARAILYAADNDIPILNFSFGDIYPSLTMREAIRYAYARGCVMIGSAGNGTGDQVHYPSNYDEVISVSATALSFNQTDEILWPLSSFGVTVSLTAPGSNIYAPMPPDSSGQDHDYFSGTSCSAPMVSGAVALLFSQRGPISPQQVRGILTASADDIGEEGWDHFTGAGRLNIFRALETVGGNQIQILSPSNDQGSSGPSVPISVAVLHPLLTDFSLEWMAGIEDIGVWQSLLSHQTDQVSGDTILNWDISTLPEGEYTLRLKVNLRNGYSAEDRVRFIVDRSAPVVAVKFAGQAWDNDERKLFWVYRASDPGRGELHYRKVGATQWSVQTYDRLTKNGEFLLGQDLLGSGDYEYFITMTNAAGLNGQSPVDTLTFTPTFINLYGYEPLGYSIPMGYYLEETQDLDADGLKEVLMSRYDDQLGFGRLMAYEYNGTQFSPLDSLTLKPTLIPKGIADTDADGNPELLCSVNDSLYLLERTAGAGLPKQVIFSLFDQGEYAARWADTDGDGNTELLTKDFQDYHVWEGSGPAWTRTATLADNSPGYVGSVAPRVLVHDFDADGSPETVFGDYDGDWLVYEANGASYTEVFMDSTFLEKAGSYLCSGDFDGDGAQEVFVAVHSSVLRNDDFEYDPAYWMLRVFKATGNNAWSLVWTDYLYDLDQESFNAATTLNADGDPADELLFSTYPRTYLLDFSASQYQFSWFMYGSICTHHAVGDFNGNGIDEFSLGNGVESIFWEQAGNGNGPQPVGQLWGQVVDSQSVHLQWNPSPQATEYRIWRGPYTPGGSVFISLMDSTSLTDFSDTGLTENTDYLYVLQPKNLGMTPNYGEFGGAIVLRPHDRNRLDSAIAVGPNTLALYFSQSVVDRESDKPRFVLDGNQSPLAILGSGTPGNRLLLSFSQPFSEGNHTLVADTQFLDALQGPLQPGFETAPFTYAPDTSLFSYFTHWEALSGKEAQIWFNEPMDTTVLLPSRYTLSPFGEITQVTWGDALHQSVRITSARTTFGSLGYTLYVILNGAASVAGHPILEGSGNIAAFADHEDALDSVYVYPNPYRKSDLYEGIRIVNLPQKATVTLLSVSGRKVRTLTETDGDGGLTWDLLDEGGKRIRPGIFLYKIEAEGMEPKMGQFSILE